MSSSPHDDLNLHMDDGRLKKWIYCGPLTCPRGKGMYVEHDTTLSDVLERYETLMGLYEEPTNMILTWGIPTGTHTPEKTWIQIWPMLETNKHKTMDDLGIWDIPSHRMVFMWQKQKPVMHPSVGEC